MKIDDLLTSPHEHFLERAYQTILGRKPDIPGLFHYALRLRSGVSRMVILCEMRDSPEGQSHAAKSSPQTHLERALATYRIIRWLPIGRRRWLFMPTAASGNSDKIFDWLGYAIDEARHSAVMPQTQKTSHLIHDTAVIQNPAIIPPSTSECTQVNDSPDGRLRFIKSEYLRLLGREADESGIHHYNAMLASGASRFAVSEQLMQSAEYLSRIPLAGFQPNDFIEFTRDDVRRAKLFLDGLESPPRIHIVIPSYNDYKVLDGCINSILEYGAPYIKKIIVVDDASPDQEHITFLKALHKKRTTIELNVIFNERNEGFCRNANRGLSIVPDDCDIILLNSDTKLTENSLPPLISCAIQNGGIVGSRLLYENETIQHGGGFRNFNAPNWFDHRYRAKQKFHPPALSTFDALYVTGAALYISTAVRSAIGAFDGDITMGFEDTEYCLRARRAGFPVKYAGASEIMHYESYSRGKTQSKSEIESQATFWKKYAAFFERNVTSNGKIKVIFTLKDTGVGGGHRVIFRFADFLASPSEQFDVEIWSLATPPDWYPFTNAVCFRTYRDFPALEAELSTLDAIKIATWWETAPVVWRATTLRGLPAWLAQDIETSYYKGRDLLNFLLAWGSYAPEFNYLTVNKWLGNTLSMQFHYHSRYVGLGINEKSFYKLNTNRKTRSILIAARGEPLKDFRLTKNVIKNLQSDGFSVTAFGLDIGLVHDLGGINFHYKPSDQELNQLYNSHEFFLQTSLHEGLSLPPLEAMAAGAIPIVTDSYGNREYIKNGENCIIIPRDPIAAANIIRRLDYSILASELKPGIEATLKEYSWDNSFKRLKSALLEISNLQYGETIRAA